MRFLKNVGLSVLSIVAVVYVGLFAAAFIWGESILFQPSKPTYRIEQTGYLVCKARNGSEVALFWMPTDGARYAVIYAHGNAEDIGLVQYPVERFRRLGFSVLAFDYEGYGRSGGQPTVDGLRQSALAAWDFLTREKGIAPDHIAVAGFSLGGAAACYLAAHERPRAVLLMGAFASAFHVVVSVNPFPLALLDNRVQAAHIDCPVLMFHGTDDSVVPVRNADMLFDSIKAPKRLVWLPRTDHNDLISRISLSQWDGIRQFVEAPENLANISFAKPEKKKYPAK